MAPPPAAAGRPTGLLQRCPRGAAPQHILKLSFAVFFLIYCVAQLVYVSALESRETLSTLAVRRSVEDAQAAGAAAPNVLLLIYDDMRPAFSGAGFNDPIAKTPNIDRLASRGVSFLNAHAAQTECSPARAALLTGRRPDVTKVLNINAKLRARTPLIMTLPRRLKSSKIFNFTLSIGKIFDERSSPKQDGRRSWTETPLPLVRVKHRRWTPPTAPGLAPCPEYPGEPYYQGFPTAQCVAVGSGGDTSIFHDETLTDLVLKTIKDPRTPRPWFIAVGFGLPHLPLNSDEESWTKFNRSQFMYGYDASAPRPARGAAAWTVTSNQELAAYGDWKPSPTFDVTNPGIERHARLLHAYYAAMSYADRQLGRLLRGLGPAFLDSTLLVLTGDHGFHLGDGKRLYGKKTLYNGATNVPLIFAGPSRLLPERGLVVRDPVEPLDLLPTLVDLLGLPSLEYDDLLDGTSLKPLLTQTGPSTRGLSVSQYPLSRGLMSYALKGRRWKYVAHVRGTAAQGQVVAEELYDHLLDPNETNAMAYGTEERLNAFIKMRMIFQRHRSDRWLGLVGRQDADPLRDLSGRVFHESEL